MKKSTKHLPRESLGDSYNSAPQNTKLYQFWSGPSFQSDYGFEVDTFVPISILKTLEISIES